MEDQNKIEKLLNHLKDYAGTSYRLIILNGQYALLNMVSFFSSVIIIGLSILFVILFGSIAVSIWLGEYFNSAFIGFFCISGFYILVSILIFFNREKWIKIPLSNRLVKQLNSDDKN